MIVINYLTYLNPHNPIHLLFRILFCPLAPSGFGNESLLCEGVCQNKTKVLSFSPSSVGRLHQFTKKMRRRLVFNS